MFLIGNKMLYYYMDVLSLITYEPRPNYVKRALVAIALMTIITLPGCTVSEPIDIPSIPGPKISNFTPMPPEKINVEMEETATPVTPQLPPSETQQNPYSMEEIQTRKGEWKKPFPKEVQRKPYSGPHSGYIGAVDIPLPEGTPLMSMSNGIVVQVETKDEWDSTINKPETRGGISLTIMTFDEKGRPVIIRYSHMQSIDDSIKVGQKINSGQSIGNSGHSGNASRLLAKYPYDANQVHIGIRPLDQELHDKFDYEFVQEVLNGGSIPNLPYNTVRGGTQYDPHLFINTLLTDPPQAELSVIYR